MSGYVQFRFAMGAPDKEARFLKAVKETTARLKSKYPTFYAWHGSMLQNWHSIIREGQSNTHAAFSNLLDSNAAVTLKHCHVST